MTVAESRRAIGRTFSSLRNRNYRYYFAGQSVSMIGTWMQSVTQSWLVYARTHSGVQVGLIVALQTLPILLLGPFGGTLADRFGKYRMLFYTQALAGRAGPGAGRARTDRPSAALGAVPHRRVALGSSTWWTTRPGRPSSSRWSAVKSCANAVTLNSVMVNVARAIGPAVAGMLIATVGSGWCFLINALSFGFVLGSRCDAIQTEELTPAPRAPRMRGQLLEGFRYVGRNPLLRDTLIMMAVIGCLTYEFQTTLPLLDRKHVPRRLADLRLPDRLHGGRGRRRWPGRRQPPATGPPPPGHHRHRLRVVVLAAALAPSLVTEEILLFGVGACSVTLPVARQLDAAARGRSRPCGAG